MGHDRPGRVTRLACLASASAALCSTAALAMNDLETGALRYTIELVEHPDAQSLVIKDINESGDAAGFAFLGFGQPITHKPFIWKDGVPTILPTTAYWTDGLRINDAGLCVGVDFDDGHVLHYTENATTDLGDLGDLFGVSMYFRAMNDDGRFAGYRPLGSSRYEGFTWSEASGIIKVAPDQSSSQANDINAAGDVVGYVGLHYEARAFHYRDGVRTDFGAGWTGDSRALSIDDSGRILVEHDDDAVGTARYQVVDADTLTILYEGPTFPADAYSEQVVAAETGAMATCWVESSTGPHLGVWTLESGMQEIALPEGTIQALITTGNEQGDILGVVLNQQYQHTPYVASLSGGFMPLQERVIGESPATLDLCSVIDMNDAGQVAVEFCSNSYGPCAILTPARPGDANGDGLVNGTDLALILGHWGQYPTDGVCGPDLDMNGVIDGVDLTLCLGDWDV